MSIRKEAKKDADNPDDARKILADYWEQMNAAPQTDQSLRIKKSAIQRFRGVIITVKGGKEGMLGFVIDITDSSLVLGNIIPCNDGRFDFIDPIMVPLEDIDDDVIQLPPGYTPTAVSNRWITSLRNK